MADTAHLAAGGLLMLGMDIGYNVGSFSLSAPQTTQRRIQDQEGASETPEQSMEWVWISTWKMIAYTGLGSLVTRTWWPLIGGMIVVVDCHASYRYAIARGQKQMPARFGNRDVSSGYAVTGATWLGASDVG